MPYTFYSFLHLVGLALLVFSFGASVHLAISSPGTKSRWISLVHGIALAVMFVAGFGLIAKLKIQTPWPGWIWLKLVVWLALGIFPLIIRKRLLKPGVSAVVLGLLVSLAVYMVVYKPF